MNDLSATITETSKGFAYTVTDGEHTVTRNSKRGDYGYAVVAGPTWDGQAFGFSLRGDRAKAMTEVDRDRRWIASGTAPEGRWVQAVEVRREQGRG